MTHTTETHPPRAITRQQGFGLVELAISLTLIVGLTRIYLGVHWTTDVLAGWSIGSAWAMALWLVADAVQRRQAGRSAGPHDASAPDPVVGEA
jgi:undecaprenyl-diphosphatase